LPEGFLGLFRPSQEPVGVHIGRSKTGGYRGRCQRMISRPSATS
jgi:hypothetical protein